VWSRTDAQEELPESCKISPAGFGRPHRNQQLGRGTTFAYEVGGEFCRMNPNLPKLAQDRLGQLDFEKRWQTNHRHWISDLILMLVVAGLAGAAWYVFPIL
jgi:hypothetical protein